MKSWTWTKPGQHCIRSSKIHTSHNNVKDEVHQAFLQKYTRSSYEPTKQQENNESYLNQTPKNPYMKNNNYVEDLMTECIYLRPQNSNNRIKQ